MEELGVSALYPKIQETLFYVGLVNTETLAKN